MQHTLAFATSFLLASHAQAHGGHGLPGSHWHGTDAWGFVALAVVVSLAVWMSRGKK